MNTTPLTDSKLDEIAGRAAGLYEYATGLDAVWQAEADQLAGTDVPALLAEIRRLRAHGAELQVGLNDLAALVSQWHSRAEKAETRVAELEAYAYGCDGEGCVIPHSSWCELAKKTAAANNGCTCPRPWEGHPQPHAGYCWLVSPPRAEVEEMRKRIAELTADAAGSNR